jgi:hypothetical protein
LQILLNYFPPLPLTFTVNPIYFHHHNFDHHHHHSIHHLIPFYLKNFTNQIYLIRLIYQNPTQEFALNHRFHVDHSNYLFQESSKYDLNLKNLSPIYHSFSIAFACE